MIVWSFRHAKQLHPIRFALLLVTLTGALLAQTDIGQLETSGTDDGYYDYYGNQAASALKTQNRAVPDLSTSTAKTPIEDTYNYDYNYDDEAYDYSKIDYNDPKHQFIGKAPDDTPVKKEDDINILEQTTSTGTYTTQKSSPSKLWEIMAKPGILAGLVGGAIIGVLTAVLLIMFIVYRMKKKDEGSYALEETKKPLNAYDYRNCPTKEFYA